MGLGAGLLTSLPGLCHLPSSPQTSLTRRQGLLERKGKPDFREKRVGQRDRQLLGTGGHNTELPMVSISATVSCALLFCAICPAV